MALQTSAFSEDGKYFAQILSDGKLKLWNTLSNSLEQEFTPDFHLTTPCTCLHFWDVQQGLEKGSPSPKKKKRKEALQIPNIILGSTSGIVLVYSVTKGKIDYTINSNSNAQINCLSIANNFLYSGADQNIFEWNLRKKELKTQWKGGNETITAILVLPDGNSLLTASKNIKLWNIESRKVLCTFTGHSTDVVLMHYVSLPGADSYIISGSKADRLLSCWNLNQEHRAKTAVCNYLMQDAVQYVSIDVSSEGLTSVAATNKSGAVHVFQHKLNGKCDKPLKPQTTLQVVSDTGQSNEPVKPIKIFGAKFADSQTLRIGHGSEILLTFENVTLSSKKVEVLLRTDPHQSKKSPDIEVTKVKQPIISDGVHYESTETTSIPIKRKSGIEAEIPMEQRLENLTLSKAEGKVPKVDNVAQLLLQGLHSKDRNILRIALCRKDETVIRNTVKRLPATVFEPFIAELSSLIHGKTILSRFGALWLKHLAQVHTAVLISNPNLSEIFSTILGSIHHRINTQTSLNRLRGKLELLVPQVNTSTNDVDDEEDALLVFNDKDSSDSESEEEMPLEIPSDSEPENWEEQDDEELNMENHVNDGTESDNSVVMLDNGQDSD
ncbi:hypothetical protein ABEB36_001423 [Hypothenemus hampei]|uniref:Small-subunit processome Utp12 domain-containing protein n=1 Tax=Hypothenemus hampei TaxID=57062 RepID=A0ABD1FGC2_HYPHA